jgi:hypothetical protein
MTVTAYFLTDKIKVVSWVLCTLAFEVSHTAENLAAHLKSVTANWRIPCEKICGFVSNNAANIRKQSSPYVNGGIYSALITP